MNATRKNSRLSRTWWLAAPSLALLGCPQAVVWLGYDDAGIHGSADAGSGSDPTQPGSGEAGGGGAVAVAGEPAAGAGGAVPGAGAAGDTGSAGEDGSAGNMRAGSGGASDGSAGTENAGDGGAGTGDAGDGGSGAAEPELPTAQATCPTMASGMTSFLGISVRLWAGTRSDAQQSPVVIYWHATGSSATEPEMTLGSAIIDDITGQGGVLAAPTATSGTGTDYGNGTWFSDDFAIADEIVACAVQQLNIDPRRIYTIGASYGGLQAGAMLFQRSSYIAAGFTNSGGLAFPVEAQDEHTPAVITTHGSVDVDVVSVTFAETSLTLDNQIASRGGFAVNCDHGGGHVQSPANLVAAAWQFLEDHPFGVTPEPYAGGLPASFPGYCQIF